MKRIRTATAAASLPAQVNTGTEGYFTNGDPGAGVAATQLDQAWCNGVTEEIRAVIVEVGELTPLGDDLGQMAEVVHGVRAILANETGGTTAVANKTTKASRAIIASAASSATGAGECAVVACNGGSAAGDENFVGASDTCSTGTGTDESAVLASQSSHIGLSGTQSNCAVIACLSTTIAGSTNRALAVASTTCGVASGLSFVAACDTCTTSTGFEHAAIGVYNGHIDGTRAVIMAGEDIGADGESCLTAASYDAETDGTRSASIGCYGTNVGATRQGAVLLGSKNAEVGQSFCVALGYHASVKPTFSDSDQNLTIRLQATTGDIFCDGTAGAGAADVAEYVENAAGVPLEPGLLVTIGEDGARVAGPGDDVDGVTSAAPMLVGNAAPLNWSGRHLRDEWGRRVMQEVPHVSWAPAVEEVDGVRRATRGGYNGTLADAPLPVPDDATRYSVAVPVDSPDYDPSRRYVPRAERPDAWACVAICGQVRVRVVSGVTPGALLEAGKGGVGVAAKRGARPAGAQIKVVRITQPYDAAKGYAIAHCWVR